jgi:mercuric ion transport protein
MDDRTNIAATTGAGGLSAIASLFGLCCVGPWAVALFGVTGAITMARFAFLRPYLLGVAALLLGWAFWRTYRPRPMCADATCQAAPSVWLKSTLWLTAALVLAAFFADELLSLVVDPTPEGLR